MVHSNAQPFVPYLNLRGRIPYLHPRDVVEDKSEDNDACCGWRTICGFFASDCVVSVEMELFMRFCRLEIPRVGLCIIVVLVAIDAMVLVLATASALSMRSSSSSTAELALAALSGTVQVGLSCPVILSSVLLSSLEFAVAFSSCLSSAVFCECFTTRVIWLDKSFGFSWSLVCDG